MSSVGGQTTAPGFGAHCATKFALEGLTETLQEEVAPFGIRTMIVEPGAFRTGLFRKDAAYFSADMPEYEETVGPTRAYVRGEHLKQPGDPVLAARAILTALDSDDPHYGWSSVRMRSGISASFERLQGELDSWAELGEGDLDRGRASGFLTSAPSRVGLGYAMNPGAFLSPVWRNPRKGG